MPAKRPKTNEPTPDLDRIDDAVLALLWITVMQERIGDFVVARAWKGHDWEALDRLHKKGLIDNPKGTAKSIVFTEEGMIKSKELFERLFCESPGASKVTKVRHRFPGAAARRWAEIPKDIQARLLKNVWCPHCRKVCTIEDFTAILEEYDLILRGFCSNCGHVVARLIEPPD